MFLSQSALDGWGSIFSQLFPWEQTTLLIIFFSGLFFMFLAACLIGVDRSQKKLLPKIGSFCGVVFFPLICLSFISFGSFIYGNSHGWTKGLLFFCVVPLCFACVVFSLFYIYTFILESCLGSWKNLFKKYTWRDWVLLIISPILVVASGKGIAFFFGGC